MTIQDESRRSGLSEPTLRYYEQVGLIGPIERDESGSASDGPSGPSSGPRDRPRHARSAHGPGRPRPDRAPAQAGRAHATGHTDNPGRCNQRTRNRSARPPAATPRPRSAMGRSGPSRSARPDWPAPTRPPHGAGATPPPPPSHLPGTACRRAARPWRPQASLIASLPCSLLIQPSVMQASCSVHRPSRS